MANKDCGVVVPRRPRWLQTALPETRTRNFVHALVGGLTFGLVGTTIRGGYMNTGTRYHGWMGVWLVWRRALCFSECSSRGDGLFGFSLMGLERRGSPGTPPVYGTGWANSLMG